MRLFHVGKDGGPYSTVTGYWLVEIKGLFSVALLKFEDGSRDAFHTHAFNCISWVLTGGLREEDIDGKVTYHKPGPKPVLTWRDTFHRVVSQGTSWVLTFRGPWSKRWLEYSPKTGGLTTLAHGRVVVSGV